MSIEQGLAAAAGEAAAGRIVFPRDLQGFPGTVHGGAVGALFHRLALPRPPVHLRLDLLRGVPTDTPLRLTTGSDGQTARLALDQDGRRLAEATLARGATPLADPGPLWAAWRADQSAERELPGTTHCLACGSDNPLGLAIRFKANARFVWRAYEPPVAYRRPDGTLHPALAPILLDELGWWLGALSQRECGVTTVLGLTLPRALPAGPVLALADRRAVLPDEDPRGRYSRSDVYLLDQQGLLLAHAEVRFAGSRAYTRRLRAPFLETTPRSTLLELFPSLGSGEAPDARDDS